MTEKEMNPLLKAIVTINTIEERTTAQGKKVWFVKATDLEDMQEISISMFDEKERLLLGVYEGTGKSCTIYFRKNGDYLNYEKHEEVPGEKPTPKDTFKPTANVTTAPTGTQTIKTTNDRIFEGQCFNNAATIIAATMSTTNTTYIEQYPDQTARAVKKLAQALYKTMKKVNYHE